MEKIKDAIGLGATGREGQEPVSGEQGAGTATEPYDAGNREGARGIPSMPALLIGPYADAQHQTILHSAAKILKRQVTSPSLKSDTRHVLTVRMTTDAHQMTGDASTTAAADSATSSGKSESPPSSTANNKATVAETSPPKETNNRDSGGDTDKLAIGSSGWFKTAIPIGKRKDDGSADTKGDAEATNDTQLNFPQNHLRNEVPPGHGVNITDDEKENLSEEQNDSKSITTATATAGGVTSIFSMLNPFAPSSIEEAAKASCGDSVASEYKTSEPPTIAGHKEIIVPIQSVPKVSEEESQATTGPRPDKGKGKAKVRDDPPPREARGSNPSAIPLAGGKPVGSGALDRRRSVVLAAISDAAMVRDPETARNTEANIGKAEPKSSDMPNGGPRNSTATATVSSEAASSTRGGMSSTASPSSNVGDGEKSSRRRSVIDKMRGLKSKLSGSKA